MNNTGILKKCLEELKKESPRTEYVIGMLEALLEMAGVPGTDSSPKLVVAGSTPAPVAELDTPLPPLPNLSHIKAIAEQSMG